MSITGNPGRARMSTRCIRRLRLDRNPLRRTSDRLEGAVLAVLFVLIVGALAMAAIVTLNVYRTGVGVERVQALERHPITAVLLEDAVASASTVESSQGSPTQPPTRARWTAPDGTTRQGLVPATMGSEAGGEVTVWVNAAGRPVPEPQHRVETVSRTLLTGAGVAVAAIVGLALPYHAFRRGLDRRRLRQWEDSWAKVEPQWSGRRR
ncbi:MAG: Rv1733c family protein [Carbonactinosporaceae bacterium]